MTAEYVVMWWMWIARALVVVTALVPVPAVGLEGTALQPRGQSDNELTERYIQKTIDRHIASTEKQLDVMRSYVEKLIDAKTNAYEVLKTIVLGVGVLVLGGVLYTYKVGARVAALEKEMTSSMKTVTECHDDMKKLFERASDSYRLSRERNQTIAALVREHSKELDSEGAQIDQAWLIGLLKNAMIVDNLYSGNRNFVAQAVSQINAVEEESIIATVVRDAKIGLEEVYAKYSDGHNLVAEFAKLKLSPVSA